jgi:hypothetical protein
LTELQELIALAKTSDEFSKDQKEWLNRFEDIIADAKTGKSPRSLLARLEDMMLTFQMEQMDAFFEQKGRPTYIRLSTDPVRNVYQLKITLMGSRPLIWRRILVPGYVTLTTLHDILQTVMGWCDCHLHDFACNGLRFSSLPEFEDDFDGAGAEDEAKVRLNELLTKPMSSMQYQYDFGDCWDHKIVVEKIFETDSRCNGRAVCLAGKLNTPPEDCGGIWGYYELLKALRDPEHPEHRTMSELAGPVDPDLFDIDWINRRLETVHIPDPGKRAKAAAAS